MLVNVIIVNGTHSTNHNTEEVMYCDCWER